MRAALIAAVVLSASAGIAVAAQPATPVLHGPSAVARALLRTDMAFEARSVAAGAAAAFADYMDPVDGLSFGSGAPTRGAAAIAADMAKPYAKLTLRWSPQEVFASIGDLGATWGTWSVDAKLGAKAVTGRYVTVWRKDKAGDWKGLMYIGSPDP